ncbi:MAG: hypothetical protein ACRDS0_20515 [Pseudonocardiaceae bacterium]
MIELGVLLDTMDHATTTLSCRWGCDRARCEAGRAVLARLRGACAVLIGLVAMHGLSPSAAGCHDGPGMPPAARHPPR